MVEVVDNFGTDEGTQFLEIDDEACFRVWIPSHGDDKVEVVAVPVLVGTGAKYFEVFLLRPGRVIQLVRCVKVLFSAYVDHESAPD